MDFSLSETELTIRDLAREFAQKEVAPGAAERDRTGEFPAQLVRRMAELGFWGVPFPERYGGLDAGYLAYAIAVEEIGRADASLGITYAAGVSLGSMPLFYFGNDQQKDAWLPRLVSGEALAAFCLTEPNAGSDAGGIETTAVRRGDGWLVNGTKQFITNGTKAALYVVAALTDPAKRQHGGISNFLVPADTRGVSSRNPYEKLGLHSSDTAEVVFQDVAVPAENLLGQVGEGFPQFMQVLDGGRISIAALSVGIAQACLDVALPYAKERQQFGRPIGKFQAVAFKLADMATRVELARLATYRAAWLKDHGLPYSKEAAMAKLVASETCVDAALEAVQILGGYGYMREYPAERLLRDAKLMVIGEGTSEIQRLVISRQLGL